MTWALTVFVDLIAAVAVGCVLSSLIYVNYMAVQQLKNCEILTPSNLHSATGPTNGNRIIGAKEAELLKDSDGGLSSLLPLNLGSGQKVLQHVAAACCYCVLLQLVPCMDSDESFEGVPRQLHTAMRCCCMCCFVWGS